jgi:RimJ/RimL family protein N-acetyltransferase
LPHAYQTSRLSLEEVSSKTPVNATLVSTIEILTPKVVENLPAYFQNINSISEAHDWFQKMVSDSRLFMVTSKGTNTIIGFVFVYVGNNKEAHIGYLLGESYWGKGYATELLSGLIDFIKQENKIKRLIAGVTSNNIVSSKVLLKIGFVESTIENNETIIYEYQLSPE